MTKIVIDAMGGDFAPYEQIKGTVDALNKDADLSVILCGDETQIKAELAKYEYDTSRVEIVHTSEVITMEDAPALAVKTKKDSYLVVAFNILKENKADGLVSSGSTGAVLTAAVTRIGRIKGISRPALCPSMPNGKNGTTLLCDCGANLECKPVYLQHFAILATAYAQARGISQNPTVGLLNNGTEDHKGDLVHQEANALLKEMSCINYVGNVEGREIMSGDVDVVVSDGYTGNIALKSIEGTAKAMGGIMKKSFKRNFFTKLRSLFVLDVVGNIKKSFDYEAQGGAVLLGLPKAVVKGHGNSKAKSFAACIAQATDCVRGDMVRKVEEMLQKVNAEAAAKEVAEGKND
ncbi:MAG: phosphate acyltransferase PlsX [Clostridia bacterium]|nr:phosphate acyltransferase PlsX [Clostridia bacterium]